MVLRTVLNPRSVSAFFLYCLCFLELLFVELYFLWLGHRGELIHFGLVWRNHIYGTDGLYMNFALRD